MDYGNHKIKHFVMIALSLLFMVTLTPCLFMDNATSMNQSLTGTNDSMPCHNASDDAKSSSSSNHCDRVCICDIIDQFQWTSHHISINNESPYRLTMPWLMPTDLFQVNAIISPPLPPPQKS